MVFFKSWEADGDCRAAAKRAVDLNVSVVEFRATLHEQKTEAGAGAVADIGAAMEGGEQPGLIVLRNADALVANDTNRIRTIAADT